MPSSSGPTVKIRNRGVAPLQKWSDSPLDPGTDEYGVNITCLVLARRIPIKTNKKTLIAGSGSVALVPRSLKAAKPQNGFRAFDLGLLTLPNGCLSFFVTWPFRGSVSVWGTGNANGRSTVHHFETQQKFPSSGWEHHLGRLKLLCPCDV